MSTPSRNLYRARVEPRIDLATGERICVWCEGTLEGMKASARFCSHDCRNLYHSAQRHGKPGFGIGERGY